MGYGGTILIPRSPHGEDKIYALKVNNHVSNPNRTNAKIILNNLFFSSVIENISLV
jgi:hypothetical protein